MKTTTFDLSIQLRNFPTSQQQIKTPPYHHYFHFHPEKKRRRRRKVGDVEFDRWGEIKWWIGRVLSKAFSNPKIWNQKKVNNE